MWKSFDMEGIDLAVIYHQLNVSPSYVPIG